MGAGTAERSSSTPSALDFDDEADPRRDRLGWVRGAIATAVVALAAAIVVVGAVLIVGSVEPAEPVRAAAATTSASAAPTDSVAPAPAVPAPPATPAAAETTPPPAPPATTAPPVQATGRAAQGDRSLSFVVSTADLHAGRATSISISGTGPADDRVQRVTVTIADGTELTSGVAAGCAGPAYPWSQSFTITFPQAEATELRVQLTSCTGQVLTATSPVDIQP